MKAIAVIAAVLAVGVADAAAAPQTIHVTEKQTFQTYVDNGAKGESAGDIRTFGGTLFNAAGKRVGHDRIRCVVGRACGARIWLQDGSLVSASFAVTGPRFTAAIAGGTGAYAGATGTATVALGKVSRYTILLER